VLLLVALAAERLQVAEPVIAAHVKGGLMVALKMLC